MNVPGVGAGPTGTELFTALRVLAAPQGGLVDALQGVPQSGDTITATLRQLSETAVLRFLEIIDRPPSVENAARLENLLRASVSAASEGKVQQALAKMAEYAALDPRRAQTIASEPGLASIRPEAGQLLSRLAYAAQLDAESRLGQATPLLAAPAPQPPPGQEFSPEIAILIAGRLLEAGGYANCMCSAQLSQMVINQYGFAPTPAPLALVDPKSPPIPSERVSLRLARQWLASIGKWIGKLWLRAPLLVLLLAWLAIGLVGGSVFAILRSYWPQTWIESLLAEGFAVWGIGFLALVGFGFYTRVRNRRR